MKERSIALRRLLPGSIEAKLVEELQEGPGTPREIAEGIGMNVRLCSAHLSNLYRKKIIDRKPWGSRGFLYEAKNEEDEHEQ